MDLSALSVWRSGYWYGWVQESVQNGSKTGLIRLSRGRCRHNKTRFDYSVFCSTCSVRRKQEKNLYHRWGQVPVVWWR